jgi:tetraacyldisaccharide 4'-kinase
MTENLVREAWQRKGFGSKFLAALLFPSSLIFAGVVQLRNGLFRIGWKKSVRLPRPVISVGNLTVGGTGKTPTCLWLAGQLRQRGFRVAILSRGYRRRDRQTQVLLPAAEQTAAAEQEEEIFKAGDEPLMMARLYRESVGVAANRRDAAAALLNRAEFDVFILDDGFQHRQVARDVDVVLLGSDASGRMLPAGRFREPIKNLGRADFLLTTAEHGRWNGLIPERFAKATYRGKLRPVSLVGFSSAGVKEHPLTLLYRSKILAVTGVADPSGLYQILHEFDGDITRTLEFPDHHLYTLADWQEINRMARLVDLIVTTEKDILKLSRFPFAKDKLLALRVAMTVEGGDALIDAIVARIRIRPGGGSV